MSNTEEVTDFQRVFDVAVKYCPNLLPKNNSLIHVWIAEGCDIEKDILPAIINIGKKKPDLGSFAYFTPAIKQARDQRRKAEDIFNGKEALKPIDDEKKANALAFKRKMGMYIPSEIRWLEKYEQENGKVTV